MLPEFLPLKIKSIKSIQELSSGSSARKDLGWKCRKAVRWQAVHIDSEGDGELLKEAGDVLIDQDQIPLMSFGRICEVMLNRSKYNSSTQDFTRKPQEREIWSETFNLFSVAAIHPGFLSRELRSQVKSRDFTFQEAQAVWIVTKILALFDPTKVFDIADSKLSLEALNDELAVWYKVHGVSRWFKTVNLHDNSEILSHFGLPNVQIGVLESEDDHEQKMVDYRVDHLGEQSILNVISHSGYQTFVLNADHPIIGKLSGASGQEVIMTVVVSLIRSMEVLNVPNNIADDILERLNLELKRMSRNSSNLSITRNS